MDYIRFSVDGQRLDYDRKYYSSTDTIDTLYCNFKFETDDLGHILGGWDLPYLWAQFHDENGNVYIKTVEDNVCSVPFDCLRQHKFKMTLFATDTQDYMSCTKRYTTNEIAFKFKGIANINYDGGVSPDEPMPTNWQLLLDRVDECESTVEGLSQDVSAIGDTVDTLSQDVSTTVSRVDTLSQNVSSMQSTVTELSTELDDESTARENADTNLQSAINDESTSRANADTRLEGLIDDRYTKAETDALVNTKQDSLSVSQLATVNSGLTSSDKTTLDDLSQSVPSMESDISGLDTRVTANANAIDGINTAVGELSTGLTDESTARANADADLQSAISDRYTKAETDTLLDTESTARTAADTRLEGLISDETAAREQLENEDIPRWFTEESNYRINGDNNLQQNIDTLSTRESNHYSSSMSRMDNLDGRITSNTSTLGAVTSSLGTMSQNITSMQSAIDELNTGLTDESTARANADTRLEGLINDEATARENADAELQSAIENDLANYYTKGEIIKLLSNINRGKWTELVSIVQSGKANDYFNYGDQIIEDWVDIDNNNKAYQNSWDVAKFDDSMEAEDGSTFKGMYLKMHYAMLKSVQFSHQRAFYAAVDGLTAGTYNVSFGADWGNAKNGKTYQFTLSQSVEVGGRLSGFYGMPDTQPSGWKVYSYGADGKTLKETVNVIEGSEGTSLGTLQLNVRDGNLNSMQETGYGCNDWEISAMRQYLNSRAGKGAWWQPQDKWDIAPDQLNTISGFLSGVSDDFYNAMRAVKVTTFKNNPTYSGASSVTYDKVFLPSLEEMYVNPQKTGEGTYYPLIKATCGLNAPMAQYGTYPKIITYALENHSSAQYVRLRSANVGGACSPWFVNSSGHVSNDTASNAFRACPVCVIG